MEQINKIRVAMVCHFSNSEVRSHLPLDNRRFYSFVRRIFNKPNKGKGYGDIAQWNTNIIKCLMEKEDLELHVISAHSGLKKRVVSYKEHGVYFSFVRCEMANMLKYIVPNSSIWRKMNPMVKDVHRLIRQIQPDIVFLMGAENAYYSSTILGLSEYPVYVICQTIYNNPDRAVYSEIDSKNASTEMEIIKECCYFGVHSKMHYDLLHNIAPDKKIFNFDFPSSGELLESIVCEKKYDFVNFAMGMSEKKGFTDAIEATALVKKTHHNIRLNLVGGCDEIQKSILNDLIKKYGLQENVTFTPFFEKITDLFYHIQQSRFALLPCKLDNISTTMHQSMQLGLPLIVYKTKGTPTINKEKECALIAELCNVDDLAAKMLELMENPEKAEMLKNNAREFEQKMVANDKHNGERLVSNFKSIIANFKYGTPIPNEQLFNPEKDD